MKRLLAIIGALSIISGYYVSADEVKQIFNSNNYSAEAKAVAIEELSVELEQLYMDLENGVNPYGKGRRCNNF